MNYGGWFTEDKDKEWDDKRQKGNKKKELHDLEPMPPLEGNEEEVQEEDRLKILTPNKLLTRLQILLARIKARNNSWKVKNEIKQIL